MLADRSAFSSMYKGPRFISTMATTSVFSRSKTGSKSYSEATEPEFEFDVREDEEQGIKLGQTIDLFLAAGYFRARIKGLSSFDKVVGGMVWCITTCSFDVDVDLLFQENSTIGQKIALTEKIVSVLPRMKCPHRIEPHQIQGLDFIHIFPVVQWLVKKAMETREEMGDYIRQYSISQFDKNYVMPEDERKKNTIVTSMKTVQEVKNGYRPERRYKRHDADSLVDEEVRVHSTLLEYGRRYVVGKSSRSEKEGELASKKAAVEAGMMDREAMSEQDALEEERRIQHLMSGMSATCENESGRLSASAVGSIVGLQSQEIQQIASEYADKQAELEIGEKGVKVAGAQQHKRLIASLQKQIELQSEKLRQVQGQHQELHDALAQTQAQLKKVQEVGAQLDEEMTQLTEAESEANQGVLQTLRSLVAMNESLKKQEQQFRAHCKEEMARLQEEIAKLKAAGGLDENSDEQERKKLIEQQYEADREKLQKIRLLLARKNREISGLQRKIDEVPSRAELSQYQRRFIELYNQVAAKYKETKQFYTLYNTLDDTKLYLNKEVNLLNSIHDNFVTAMSSPANREQFLKQMEQIVEGVKLNRTKLDQKKQSEKMQRDQLNDQYLDLIEKQRLYFKTVRDFKEECRKNEILVSKSKGMNM